MSLPVSYYREHPAEIPERLDVLYEKAGRIVAYNGTLDADRLDEKQYAIMLDYSLLPGVDAFPAHVFVTLKRTIDRLSTIYRFAGKAAA